MPPTSTSGRYFGRDKCVPAGKGSLGTFGNSLRALPPPPLSRQRGSPAPKEEQLMLPKSPSAVLTLLHAQHVKRQAVPQIKKDCYCIANPLMTAEVPARSCTSSCSHLLRNPAGWSCWDGNRLSVNYPDCSGRTDDTVAHCLPCPTFSPSGCQDFLRCSPCSGGVPPCNTRACWVGGDALMPWSCAWQGLPQP